MSRARFDGLHEHIVATAALEDPPNEFGPASFVGFPHRVAAADVAVSWTTTVAAVGLPNEIFGFAAAFGFRFGHLQSVAA
jgi:hypothetical protein